MSATDNPSEVEVALKLGISEDKLATIRRAQTSGRVLPFEFPQWAERAREVSEQELTRLLKDLPCKLHMKPVGWDGGPEPFDVPPHVKDLVRRAQTSSKARLTPTEVAAVIRASEAALCYFHQRKKRIGEKVDADFADSVYAEEIAPMWETAEAEYSAARLAGESGRAIAALGQLSLRLGDLLDRVGWARHTPDPDSKYGANVPLPLLLGLEFVEFLMFPGLHIATHFHLVYRPSDPPPISRRAACRIVAALMRHAGVIPDQAYRSPNDGEDTLERQLFRHADGIHPRPGGGPPIRFLVRHQD